MLLHLDSFSSLLSSPCFSLSFIKVNMFVLVRGFCFFFRVFFGALTTALYVLIFAYHISNEFSEMMMHDDGWTIYCYVLMYRKWRWWDADVEFMNAINVKFMLFCQFSVVNGCFSKRNDFRSQWINMEKCFFSFQRCSQAVPLKDRKWKNAFLLVLSIVWLEYSINGE